MPSKGMKPSTPVAALKKVRSRRVIHPSVVNGKANAFTKSTQ